MQDSDASYPSIQVVPAGETAVRVMVDGAMSHGTENVILPSCTPPARQVALIPVAELLMMAQARPGTSVCSALGTDDEARLLLKEKMTALKCGFTTYDYCAV